jgi:hypothetical protein
MVGAQGGMGRGSGMCDGRWGGGVCAHNRSMFVVHPPVIFTLYATATCDVMLSC